MSFQPGLGQPGVAQPGVAGAAVAATPIAASDASALAIADTATVVVVAELAVSDALAVGITDSAVTGVLLAVADSAALSITEAAPTLLKEYPPYQTPSEVRSHMSTTIRQAAPTTAEPQSTYLRLDGTAGAEMRALLDVGRTVPIGVGARVVRADLILTQAEPNPGAYTLTAEPLNGGWEAETVTWNTAPTVRPEASTLAVPIGGSEGTQLTIDATLLVQTAVASDDAAASRWFGFRLRKSTAGSHKLYSSYAEPDYRPILKIEWSVPPAAPEDLAPAGSRSVSETKPELAARFFDQDAEDIISAIRVEIDDADDFTTLTYDSGWVPHTAPRFDLAAPPTGAPATPTLATATTYYWRMTVRDNHGLSSPVSDIASFVVTAKGTTTLTYPSGPSVTSPTPTITHTFSGTQQSVEVEIERKVAGIWERHYFVPRYVSTATSHTVPNAYRLVEGETYRVAVRVWDATNREDVPGDRAFSEASREFTLAPLS